MDAHRGVVDAAVAGARVLVIGGAGSIGREVTAEIFQRQPAALHVIDVSENSLVELVRNLRSEYGHIAGETVFLPLNIGSVEAQAFLDTQARYDFALNCTAIKHVRSEKDGYSLMRIVKTNVLDTLDTLRRATDAGRRQILCCAYWQGTKSCQPDWREEHHGRRDLRP